jgi:mannose-6-phosphate isomerase-like protein (cupin superfamily)
MEIARIRRIITGLDPDGHSTVVRDDSDGLFMPTAMHDGVSATILWRAGPGEPPNDDADGVTVHSRLPIGGSQHYLVRIEPGASVPLHETRSVEYHFVVSGTAFCTLEDGEVELRTGDAFVQRATAHGWENRGGVPFVSVATMLSTRTP